MIGSDEQGNRSSSRWLAGVAAVAVAWIAWGLVRHPGFQPAATLRTAAPVLALVIGGVFTRGVALVRARADAQREFDRGGKALFMGFVMVGATFVGWLLVSQALPSTWTALAGVAGSRAGVVVERPEPGNDADCRYRLVVVDASAAAPAGPDAGASGAAAVRGLEECVDDAVWRAAVVRGPVTLQVIASALGAELLAVGH